MEETRVAVIAIIVEEKESVSMHNDLLHEFGSHIIGSMCVPHKEKGVSIISVVLDAKLDIINALSGKIGRLKGVSSKTVYAKV